MREEAKEAAAIEILSAALRDRTPEIDGRGLWAPKGLEAWPWPVFLRRLRRGCGLTQKSLGKRAGMPQSAISEIEKGRDARLGTMERLLAALDCVLVLSAKPRRGLATLEENWPS